MLIRDNKPYKAEILKTSFFGAPRMNQVYCFIIDLQYRLFPVSTLQILTFLIGTWTTFCRRRTIPTAIMKETRPFLIPFSIQIKLGADLLVTINSHRRCLLYINKPLWLISRV